MALSEGVYGLGRCTHVLVRSLLFLLDSTETKLAFFFFLPLLTIDSSFSISLFSTQEGVQGLQTVLYCVQTLKPQSPKFTVSAIIESGLLYLRLYFEPFTNTN